MVLIAVLLLPSEAWCDWGIERSVHASGLIVITQVDRRAPRITVATALASGSADDPVRKGGVATLTAHLASADRIAVTRDNTVFIDDVERDELAVALRKSADRFELSSPAVEGVRGQLSASRSMLTALTGLVLQGDWGAGHAPRRDLATVTADDVQQFHAAHYRFDRAAIIVIGDFDPARLSTLLDQHFTRSKRSPVRPPPPPPVVQQSRRSLTMRAEHSQHAAVALGWAVPGRQHVDRPALELCAELLAGPYSRTTAQLVRSKGDAYSLSGGVLDGGGRGLLWLSGDLRRAVKPAVSAAMFDKEVRRLQDGGPKPAELDAAMRALETRALLEMQDPAQLSLRLAESAWLDGDAIRHMLERHRAVTPADIQRVAKRYLQAHLTSVVEVSPARIRVRDDK